MKIGIYNRYWNTFGGGENYTGSVAEILSRDHEVELISIEPVDWSRLESRLHLDLSRCTMREWPNEPCERLSPRSSHYDLFVNSTYSSSLMPRAKKSALICYFPHRVDALSSMRGRAVQWVRELVRGSKRDLLRIGRRRGDVITPVAGVYDVEPDGRAWISAEAILMVAGAQSRPVRIPLWPEAYNGIEMIRLDGEELPWHMEGNILHVPCKPNDKRHSRLLSIFCKPVVMSELALSSDSRQLGACIDTRSLKWGSEGALKRHSPRDALRAYDRIISISNFTSEWIDRRWQLPSTELQPPIDTKLFGLDGPPAKEKIILTVGRFFAGGHNKKHHEIASAFIRLRQEGVIPDGWRLVFVGSRHREHQMHLDYFDRLTELCAGHPIDILPDLPFADLLTYYRKASIYWHGAGWGERVEQFPERFEHFGMTTCEAMACACVPVVFDAAGQREIVASEDLGFRYSTYEMLATQMGMLVNASPEMLAQIGERAQKSIERFARANFQARVREAFRGLAY
ncbi:MULTISPECIES: glycosyltransferase family 4 protein [Pseudomonas]|jgi:glycosyltransferase involved in cell wall biosynthesis|uniref:Glycosyltransferase family 4 protein n=1 Tax=Pseudomonas asgharzadehiana TaxID=2842349 RepID=A0ABX8P7M6_9PSED|nr:MULTISPECIES: glycosyltransferase family 4 protein [Pseudomonas]CRM93983.1 Glycosyl transferases group 1 [Pseudomonas sp. 22 E 5]MCX9151553.1 glycosyltransferase family 4 protein [Pseudomonas sp. TB1-B1]QXH69495.1 glycosyltransferase family 4 protein [Pseudomonas asgharzadehiana]TKJ61237.1 group 1 family glycosyltransferase [Pseudomonas sp. CFBP13506]CRM46375.1 Glycosyl transferases group 1 [Pseudomonas sp. 31 E 5]